MAMKYEPPGTRPSEWTDAERLAAARHLADTKTLKQLRQNQRSTEEQIKMAFNMNSRAAMENLQIMLDIYTSAVFMQYFTE